MRENFLPPAERENLRPPDDKRLSGVRERRLPGDLGGLLPTGDLDICLALCEMDLDLDLLADLDDLLADLDDLLTGLLDLEWEGGGMSAITAEFCITFIPKIGTCACMTTGLGGGRLFGVCGCGRDDGGS